MGYMEDKDIDIAGICETWLTDSSNATTAIIKSHGFSLMHDYRAGQKGGGTAIIYKSCLNLSVVKFSECFKSFEMTAAIIKTSITKIMVLVIYRAGPLTSIFNHELDQLLSNCSRMCDCVFLAGDLNIHFSSATGVVKHTLDITNSYGLVNEATHIGGGSLDQIFSSALGNTNIEFSTTVDSSDGLGSDHFPVLCDLTISPDRKYFKSIVYRKLKDIDSDQFSSDLTDIVDGIDSKDSFEAQVQDLSTALKCLLDEHAPCVTKSVSVVDSAPWFDSEYRELRKKRRRAESKKSRSPEAYMFYKNLCEEANQLSNIKKKQYFNRILENSQGNPKTLFKMVNNVMDRDL